MLRLELAGLQVVDTSVPFPAGREDTAKDIMSYMGRHSYLDQAAQLAAQVGVQAVQEGHGDKLALVSS